MLSAAAKINAMSNINIISQKKTILHLKIEGNRYSSRGGGRGESLGSGE
jgi:hypothetical protein